MHNGDYPLEKIRGKNFCLGIYKSDWNMADILFWSKAGATSFLTCMTRWNPGKPYLRIWSVENHLL